LPKYFFDTSALAKVYRKEIGSDFVDRILSEPSSQQIISRLSIVEMESVLALKVRTGEIDQHSVLIARRRLEADLARRSLLVAAVNDALPTAAGTHQKPVDCGGGGGLIGSCASMGRSKR